MFQRKVLEFFSVTFLHESNIFTCLKTLVHRFELMQINHLRLPLIYLCRFYIPDLIRLANGLEPNPGRPNIDLQLMI